MSMVALLTWAPLATGFSPSLSAFTPRSGAALASTLPSQPLAVAQVARLTRLRSSVLGLKAQEGETEVVEAEAAPMDVKKELMKILCAGVGLKEAADPAKRYIPSLSGSEQHSDLVSGSFSLGTLEPAVQPREGTVGPGCELALC